MGSVIANHVPSDQIDSHFTMLGGINPDSVYSRAPQLEDRSRSTSSTTTPTSTSSTSAPPGVGSARLSSTSNDVPAYLSHTPQSVHSADPSHPPPSMTSHPSYTHSSDHPSYSNSQTPQYPQYPPSGGHAASAHPMTSAPNPYGQASPDSPRLQPTFRSMQSLGGSEANSPSRIRVKSLSHIQSLVKEDFLAPSHPSSLAGNGSHQRQFEVSSMPVTDIIEMVAGLLTKITTTNDMHHEHIHRHIPPPDGTSNLSPQATSVLAFHGKNVPSITILSYLTRIHKYCPTTYEVFLSLLVYFDRMTDLVNRGQPDGAGRRWDMTPGDQPGVSSSDAWESQSHPQTRDRDTSMVTPPSSTGMTAQDTKSPNASISPALYPQSGDDNLSHFFVVDSFNIHRLVIAGVTCASKFFSDVFYTNSRYAKVGGLPLVELNHLELQFLLLNDFRLAIPVEELEAYGTMLVEFYARETIAQQQMAMPRAIDPPSDSPSDAMYMRSRDKGWDQPEFGQTPTPP
ncbi:uncharacterized protein N7459_006924 [Penicillium hispanicum]|uniref:uncharacterized protein n=1 Tax=Penicillium hispanicum TaxID=1080232 RepID=UPI00254002C6|nr:uncharacterized protein N7459_006924 [Penicillium hispanicum]KAJ5577960.1 hypothetical protein N7459_006924 [Penicillium hispanicum]